MDPYIIVALIGGLPLLLALVLRINAVYLFVGVAAGALLNRYIADDANLVIRSFISNVSYEHVELGLLLVPVVLTLFFLRKTLKGSQVIFHLVPLVVTAAAYATMLITALPGGVRQDVLNNPVGNTLESAQNVLIGASAFLTLMLVWLTMGHKGRGKHR